MGVAGVLGVWSFEAGRQRLVSEGRLFGADADLAWRGTADEVDAAVAAARSSGGVDAVGVRWALDADLTLTGPGGSATREPERPRRRDRLGRADDRPWPRRGRAGRGGARGPVSWPSWTSTSVTRCVSGSGR